MIQSPSQIVWVAHGSPRIDGCGGAEDQRPLRCYLCGGQIDRGMLVAKWMGSGFTDQSRARNPAGSHVCEACCYVTSRTSSVLGRPPGACSVCDGTLHVVKVPKAGKGSRSRKGDECPKCDGTGKNPSGSNMRNVSHLYEQGWTGRMAPGYANASKGEKPAIRAFLERRHQGAWFAAIADTGQRHMLPFTPLNGPGRTGFVLFEESLVFVPESLVLVADMAALLTEGATKAELQSGNYGPSSWRLCETLIRTFEAEIRHTRGAPWFALALWLAQRDEEKVQARLVREKENRDAKRGRKRATGGNRLVSGGAQCSLQPNSGAQAAQALGQVSVCVSSESERCSDDRSVAGKNPCGATDHKPV